MELGIDLPMAGVETSITNHFEMLFWYVPDQSLNEFHGRNRFFYVLFVFMVIYVTDSEELGGAKFIAHFEKKEDS